ncbi:GNAT family N-acetyltransferase [Sphingomonas sp.]|uniref:GNAT family N-acetyltransferase n=1 Tax=Sphingomonas sp. TaxID=28214 RepID=UPI002DD676A1|nr:GNAT family N-acetyltransferase [Sphingomonas sp.]
MIACRDAVPGDGCELAAMAKRSFTDTFGSLYRAEDLSAFLDQAFGADGLPSQIGDPDFAIRLAIDDGRIVGFAKVGPNALPIPDAENANAVELYQLYVLASHHGDGAGPVLMDWAIGQARARGAGTLALSVYVNNHRAKAFYARYGFVDVGRFDFAVGDHVDEDRMMVLAL